MHDVLRERLLRRIESLPEEQVYQVLDFIEFLESKYARDLATEASGLQRFAERMEDRLRRRAVSPATLREAFQLISAADRVLQNVSSAGRQLFGEAADPDAPTPPEERSAPPDEPGFARRSGRSRAAAPERRPEGGADPDSPPASGARPEEGSDPPPDRSETA